MKPSLWKNLSFALLLALPIGLFLVARETASWRPRKVADLPYHGIVCISPDDRFVANASVDEKGMISVRALSGGGKTKQRTLHHLVTCLAFSPDGRSLVIGWKGIERSALTKRIGVSLWDLEGKFRDFEVVDENLLLDWPRQVRFSPDGKTLWMASTDNLRAWDRRSGQLKWRWRKGDLGRDSTLPFFSAIPKNCRLYFRSDADGYSVWDIQTRQRLLRTNLSSLADEDLFFSPDASLATYYADTRNGNFNPVIDTRTGHVLWQTDGNLGVMLTGDKAVTLTQNTCGVRDARSGKLLYALAVLSKVYLVEVDSSRWLYTVKGKHELFRQRLR